MSDNLLELKAQLRVMKQFAKMVAMSRRKNAIACAEWMMAYVKDPKTDTLDELSKLNTTGEVKG